MLGVRLTTGIIFQSMQDDMGDADHKIDQLNKQRKQMEADNDKLKTNVTDLETTIKKQVSP